MRELLPDLIRHQTFREALGALLDDVVRRKTWGRKMTRHAILEIGTSAERLPFKAPHPVARAPAGAGAARGEVRNNIASQR